MFFDGIVVIEVFEGEYILIVMKDVYNMVRWMIRVIVGFEVEVKVLLKKFFYYFIVDVFSLIKSGVLGDVFVYEVVLKNLGENDDIYMFDLKVFEGWGVFVIDDLSLRRGMGSVYVESGLDIWLYVVLILFDIVEIGDYYVVFKIIFLGSGEEKILNFMVFFLGSYGIVLFFGKYSLKIEVGKSVEFYVRVYNIGMSLFINVKFNVELLEDWKIKV